MRQVGSFAAAGPYELDHHVDRLAEDHANARTIANAIAVTRYGVIDLDTVQTNIIVWRLRDEGPDAATVVSRARDQGVLLNAFGPRTVRAVTHLDVPQAACAQAAMILAEVIDAGSP